MNESYSNNETSSTHGPAYIPDLDINLIFPNPYQPRIEIKPESIIGLSNSIKANGVLEPLIVTKKSEDKYELIAGERRLRAAKLAKLKTVPVIVKEASPLQMLELAIIENIHRQDLNPLEEALAFDQLMTLFNMDHADIAKKIGYSRPAVTNKIRLLTLPDEIKKMLLELKLTEGHARAIMGLEDNEAMIATAKVAIKDKLSVRQVEELVRRLKVGHDKKSDVRERELNSYVKSLELNLQNKFGTSVKLTKSRKGGRIVIPFKNDSELKRLYEALI